MSERPKPRPRLTNPLAIQSEIHPESSAHLTPLPETPLKPASTLGRAVLLFRLAADFINPDKNPKLSLNDITITNGSKAEEITMIARKPSEPLGFEEIEFIKRNGVEDNENPNLNYRVRVTIGVDGKLNLNGQSMISTIFMANSRFTTEVVNHLEKLSQQGKLVISATTNKVK